jgi:hypothetical protein
VKLAFVQNSQVPREVNAIEKFMEKFAFCHEILESNDYFSLGKTKEM